MKDRQTDLQSPLTEEEYQKVVIFYAGGNEFIDIPISLGVSQVHGSISVTSFLATHPSPQPFHSLRASHDPMTN